MLKSILMLIVIIISVSCQKTIDTTTIEKVTTTIGVEQPQTRVAIVPDEQSEIWNSVWQQDDKIGGYTISTTSIEEFSMVGTIEDYATTAYFNGSASPSSKMKFIYPYSSELKPSSDGLCFVNLEQQTIDMDDPYTSLGASNLYMVSNEVEIDESGVAQSNIALQHLMSALELNFTIGNIDNNYIYKVVGLRITSTDKYQTNGFYLNGYLDLSLESPEFTNGTVGTLLISIMNSPEIYSGDQITIPIVIAPATFEYKFLATVGATFSLHMTKTSRTTGDVTEDCCEYNKTLTSSSPDLNFEAGAYNTVNCSSVTTDFGTIKDSWYSFF